MPLIGSLVLFLVFALNVALGSMSSNPFLSDVGEMLVLSGAAILFVVAILKKEAAANAKAEK